MYVLCVYDKYVAKDIVNHGSISRVYKIISLLCVCLTQAEGKVDNYTELATIGPYPVKKAPQESVEYTDVIPSNVSYVC